jgi:hypothetical protein
LIDSPGNWDTFFERPAISFQTQPNIRRLFEGLVTDKKILLVLGAGVSMDAQLPGWMTLVNRLIEFNPTARRRWAEFVKDDTSEPSRKAEYIASIVESGEDAPTRSLDELIRDALYRRSKHPQPGQLADSIARLVAILGDRVTVLTTNYDVLAEEALRTYCPDVTISSVDYNSWVADSPDLSVIHLHGILKPREDPIGDVILTQSSFLRHQSSIQSFIESRLVECDIALFVGMSVTDPNIIGPLWRLKARTGIKPEVYNVAIVGMPTLQAHQSPTSRSLSAARSYAYRCAEFLESSFDVHNVYAKTFAQVSQILYDAALFATDPGRYLSDDENVSTRYGVRLSRCLDSAYASLGCEPDSDFPVGKSGIDVSNALYTELSYQSADFSRMTDQYKIDPRVPLAEFGGIAQFLQRHGVVYSLRLTAGLQPQPWHGWCVRVLLLPRTGQEAHRLRPAVPTSRTGRSYCPRALATADTQPRSAR